VTSRRADALLLLTTVFWGTTFAIIHATTAHFPPFALIALRFGISAAALLPWLFRRGALDRRLLASGVLLGIVLFVAFATQTWGLARTTPARSGFITGLYVIFVPLVSRLLGDRLPARIAAAVVLSVGGLAVLTWGCQIPGLGCSTFESALPERAIGDRFTVLCALANGVYVLGISRWTRGVSVLAMNAVQLAVVAVLAAASAWALERPIPTPSIAAVGAIVFLAAVSIITFSLMLFAQPHTDPSRASLIYSLEALFAALFSWMWLGEVPSGSLWLGGGLMMSAVLLLELPQKSAVDSA
jgi:drug/metabolite transporter (DMT)-like permease